MNRSLHNKTVVITGASEGIGANAAKLFLEKGANVALIARREAVLNDFVSTLQHQDRVLSVAADVTDLRAMEQVFVRVSQHFGGVDGLVNNAGFNARGAVVDKDVDELLKVIKVNLLAPVALCRFALPYLEKSSTPFIVNVASVAGHIPLPDEAIYSATKFALRIFSFALKEELRDAQVSVSVVSPGPVDTGFIMSNIDDVPDLVFSQPMSSPLKIAQAIVHAATTGQREITIPKMSGLLATLGYLFPIMPRLLQPLLINKGKRNKRKYLQGDFQDK